MYDFSTKVLTFWKINGNIIKFIREREILCNNLVEIWVIIKKWR